MNDDWTEFRIEGDSDDLAALKAELAKVMDPFEISEMTIPSSGQANEPLITALIIALGGATLTREVFITIRYYMDYKLKMEKLRLSVENQWRSEPASLEEIEAIDRARR